MAVGVFVIGLGIMGASAACALARHGAEVVALDPHPAASRPAAPA